MALSLLFSHFRNLRVVLWEFGLQARLPGWAFPCRVCGRAIASKGFFFLPPQPGKEIGFPMMMITS